MNAATGSQMFCLQTPLTLGVLSKGKNSTSYVVYQIKGKHNCSNMVANILPAYPAPSQPWGDLKRS